MCSQLLVEKRHIHLCPIHARVLIPSPQKCSVLLNLKRYGAFKHEALKSLIEYKVFCSILPYKTSPEMKTEHYHLRLTLQYTIASTCTLKKGGKDVMNKM